MTSDEINAELTRLGTPFDPADHWKTRQKLLNEAKAALENLDGVELTSLPTINGGVVITTFPPKTLPDIPRLQAEPTGRPDMGDKDPDVIEWRRVNWPAEKFQAKYGK